MAAGNNNNNDNISMSFNIAQDDYMTFIKNLRASITVATSHDLPVLTPQSQPVSWLDIRLVSDQRTVIIRLDRRNLYLRGYSRDGGATFWEFSDSSLIPNSRGLQFSGSYIEAGGLGSTAAVEGGRANLLLGFSKLHHAINVLANTEDPNSFADRQETARALLLMTQMFPEAARIQKIAGHISDNYWSDDELKITLEMVALEQRWQFFSSAVQRADIHFWTGNTPLPNVPNPNTSDIWTVGQAIAIFGILLWYHPSGLNLRRRSLILDVPAADKVSPSTSFARTLVSIAFVYINNIDGENPGDLYGTVKVEDCWGLHTIYDRSSNDYESKGPGDYATLTGPSDAISGDGAFVIKVNLWDHDSDASPNDEIANGEIVWDPRRKDVGFHNYDTKIQTSVDGKYGSVTVEYSVIRDALNATINVVMIDGDGESPADVYGTIKAIQVLGGGSSSTTLTLFDKSKSEHIDVYPGGSVPLRRAVVVAPVNNPLTITADLWDHDADLSPDDPIGQGSVEFIPPTAGGTQSQTIYGKYGKVQVSVTFE